MTRKIDTTRISAIDAEESLSSKFQLGIMRNIEREMPSRKRGATPNWKMVQNYILGNTSHGGSTSCRQHCYFLGVDPEGYSFWK